MEIVERERESGEREVGGDVENGGMLVAKKSRWGGKCPLGLECGDWIRRERERETRASERRRVLELSFN